MKQLIKNIGIGVLMAFMLFGSLGLSFSKISCPMGQRIVLGTEMPQYKKATRHCCLKKDKAEPKEDSDQKEDRKKETFQIKFDFKTSLVECIKVPLLDSYSIVCDIVRLNTSYVASVVQAYLFYGSSPPLLTKPELSALQSFRI